MNVGRNDSEPFFMNCSNRRITGLNQTYESLTELNHLEQLLNQHLTHLLKRSMFFFRIRNDCPKKAGSLNAIQFL